MTKKARRRYRPDVPSKSAAVTGASQGIGRAIALELAQAGWGVALQGRRKEPLEAVAAEIVAAGGRAVVVPGDATQSSAAEALVEGAHTLGPLEVAVACAGQAFSAPIKRTTEDDVRRLFEINTLGVFHLLKAAGQAISDAGGGRFVVVASTAAVAGMAYTAAYSASKHAVLGLVRSAALELAAKQVTVNAVCPGWVDTPMFDQTLDNISAKTGGSRDEARAKILARIPDRSVASVAEVAQLVGFVCSPAARHMTGQALVLDGGETLA